MKYTGTCMECGKSVTFDYVRELTENGVDRIATLKCDGEHPDSGESTGTCVFCGQVITLQDKENLPKIEKIKLATTMCNCSSAQNYNRIERQIVNAKEKINMLFGEDAVDYDFVPVKNTEVISFLEDAVEHIVNGNMQNITVQLTGRIKAKVSLTSKGNIKVERSETTKQQLEE